MFHYNLLKVVLPICELFRTKNNTQFFSYYSKPEGFYFKIIIKQFKNFLHKILQIGKTKA